MVTSGAIDREQSPILRLLVVCRDAGQPVLETVRQVVVMVDNVNDHVPLRQLVVCRDAGQPVLETVRQVVVMVDDVNDNAPQFTQSVYNVSIVENRQPPVVSWPVPSYHSVAGSTPGRRIISHIGQPSIPPG